MEEDPRWYRIWQYAKAYGLFLDARGKPDNAAYNAAYRAQLDTVESSLRPANADPDVWDDWCRWHAEHKLWNTHFQQVGRFPFEEPVRPSNLPNAFHRPRALAPIPEGRETSSRALPSSAYVNEPHRTQPLPPQPLPPQPPHYAAPPANPPNWSTQPAALVPTAHQPYSQPPVNTPPPLYQTARQYAAPPAATSNSVAEQMLATLSAQEIELLMGRLNIQFPPQPSTSQPQPPARPEDGEHTLDDSMWSFANADATEARLRAEALAQQRQEPAPSRNPSDTTGIWLPVADWEVPFLRELGLYFAPLNSDGLPRYSVVLNGHKEHAVFGAYIGRGGCRIKAVEEHYKHMLRFRWYNAGPMGIWIWVELPKKFRPTRQSTVPVGTSYLDQLERAHQFIQLWAAQPELMNIDLLLENYLNGTYGNPAELNRNQEHQEGGNIPQGSQGLDVTTTIGAIMRAPTSVEQHQDANNQWGRRKRTGRLQHVNLDRMAAHGRWVNAVAIRNRPATNAPEQPVGAAQQTASPAGVAQSQTWDSQDSAEGDTQQPALVLQTERQILSALMQDKSAQGRKLFDQYRNTQDEAVQDDILEAFTKLKTQQALTASASTGGSNAVVTSTNRFDSMQNEAPVPGEPGEPLEETEFPAAITQNFGDAASEDEDEGDGVDIGGEEGRGGVEGGEKGGELEN